VLVPIVRLGKGFIDAIVKVLVMGEDDMATNIVELCEQEKYQRGINVETNNQSVKA
jgi:hypothetical protein